MNGHNYVSQRWDKGFTDLCFLPKYNHVCLERHQFTKSSGGCLYVNQHLDVNKFHLRYLELQFNLDMITVQFSTIKDVWWQRIVVRTFQFRAKIT